MSRSDTIDYLLPPLNKTNWSFGKGLDGFNKHADGIYCCWLTCDAHGDKCKLLWVKKTHLNLKLFTVRDIVTQYNIITR